MSVPSYPTPSYQVPQARPIEPPTTVKTAFLIYLLTALLSLITLVLALTGDQWQRALTDALHEAPVQVNNTTISVESLISFVKSVTIGIGVVFLALYLFFAFKMRAGRNWARIVLTVLSGLSILSAASTQSAVRYNGRVYTSTSSVITGWIGAGLAVAAIVLMYLAASNIYFRDSKAARNALR